MKNLFLLPTLLFITGCSTTTVPSAPKPHPEKYALQVILIEVPGELANSSPITQGEKSYFLTTPDAKAAALARIPPQVTELLENPDAKISEYPVVYATVGETAINDQTETLSFPTTYEPQADSNGVVSVVYNHHKDIKIGKYTEWAPKKIENGAVTGDLWFYEKTLLGMQKYDVAPANGSHAPVSASLPIFKAREMKTKVTLVPGAWISMGGLTSTKKEGDESTTTTTYFAIRTLPPKGIPFESTQPTPQVFRFPVSELIKSP